MEQLIDIIAKYAAPVLGTWLVSDFMYTNFTILYDHKKKLLSIGPLSILTNRAIDKYGSAYGPDHENFPGLKDLL